MSEKVEEIASSLCDLVSTDRTISGNLEKVNSNDSQEKVLSPSTEARQCIESIMESHNERLYQLLEENPGTSMEQRPFPRFH